MNVRVWIGIIVIVFAWSLFPSMSFSKRLQSESNRIKVLKIGEKNDIGELSFVHDVAALRSIPGEPTDNVLQMRIAAIRVIKQFHSPQSLPVVNSLLKDEDSRIRMKTVEALVAISGETCVDQLVDLFTNDGSMYVAKSVMKSLREINSPTALRGMGDCFYFAATNEKERLVLETLFTTSGNYREAALAYQNQDIDRLKSLAPEAVPFLGKVLPKFRDSKNYMEVLEIVGQSDTRAAKAIIEKPAQNIKSEGDNAFEQEDFSKATKLYSAIIRMFPHWKEHDQVRRKLDQIQRFEEQPLEAIEMVGTFDDEEKAMFSERAAQNSLPKPTFIDDEGRRYKTRILYGPGMKPRARKVGKAIYLEDKADYVKIAELGAGIRVETGVDFRKHVAFGKAKETTGRVTVTAILMDRSLIGREVALRVHNTCKPFAGLDDYIYAGDVQGKRMLLTKAMQVRCGDVEVVGKLTEILTGRDGVAFPVLEVEYWR